MVMIRKQRKFLIVAALAILCMGKAFCKQEKGTYFTTKEAKECSQVINEAVEKEELPYVKIKTLSENDILVPSTNSCTIVLCRHGKTECNNKKIVQGTRIDDELIDQEKAFSDYITWLNQIGFNQSAVYTSPLKRAVQTGEGIIERLGKKFPLI